MSAPTLPHARRDAIPARLRRGLWWLALACLPAGAETFVEQRFGAPEGINSRGVTNLARGADGALWLSTYDGLLRFDGAGFSRLSRQDHPELPSNRVLELFPGTDGDLWLRTENQQLRRWNGRAFDLPLADGAPPLDYVRRTRFLADGRWLIGGEHAIYRERGRRLEAVCVLPDGVELLNFARSGPDEAPRHWISGATGGLWRCANGMAEKVDAPELATLAAIDTLVEDADGTLILYSHPGYWRWTKGELHPIRFPADLHADALRAPVLAQEGDGAAVIGTENGLFRLDGLRAERFFPRSRPKTINFHLVERDAQGHEWRFIGYDLYRDGEWVWRAPSLVTWALPDGEGGVFASTGLHGLIRIKPSALAVLGEAAGLRYTNLSAIAPARDGGFWAAALHGGVRYRIRDTQNDTPRVDTIDSFAKPVWSLAEDHDGQLWEGGEFLCAVRQDGCDETQVPEELRQGSGPSRQVRMIFEDARARLWVGSAAGLFLREDGTWRRLAEAPHEILRAALELPDGGILFGSNGAGLWRFSGGALRQVQGSPSPLIRSLYFSPEGWLWIGSEDIGLIRARLGGDGALHEVLRLDRSLGLPDDTIHQILPDARGRLWMNSNRGVFRLDPARLAAALAAENPVPLPVLALDARDGLAEPEGNGGFHAAGFRDGHGTLWFPGQGGAVGVRPEAIPEPQPPRPPELSAFRHDGRPLENGGVIAAHAPRALRVAISSPRFDHPERLRFRHRIAGLDEAWSAPSAQRELFFPRLPPGNFRLQVQVADAGGPWLDAANPLAFRIEPAFVESQGFLWLLAALGTLLGMALWRWRSAALRDRAQALERTVAERTGELRIEKARVEETLAIVERQKRELAALDEAKSRFFTDLSHELRTPLTLIAGPAEQALAARDVDLRAALAGIGANARRLLDLVNQILELARLEAGVYRFAPQPGDVLATLAETLRLFEAQAAQGKVELALRCPLAAAPAVFDQDALKKIVSNLVGNALRHSPPRTRITVVLEPLNDGVRLTVSDQGRGIPAAQREQVFERYYSAGRAAGSGIGLAHARELARAQGGDLDVTEAPGGGSSFRCVLPLPVSPDPVEPSLLGSPGLDTPSLLGSPGLDTPGLLGSPVPDAVESSGASSALRAADASLPPEDADAPERPCVLIVEDQPDVRAFIADCLREDFDLRLAADGGEGVALARTALPDLIVSDLMMPVLDGFGLVRALQDAPETCGIPLILLSARGGEDAQLEGLDAGAVEYLTKPFSPALLRARVRRLLGFRLRLREQLRAELAQARGQATALPEAAETPFAERLRQAILAGLCEPGFGVDALAQALEMSRSSLKRAMQDAALPAPATLIRTLRIERAMHLLEQRRGSIADVAYAVGYASQSHFTLRFREQTGTTPAEFLARRADPAS